MIKRRPGWSAWPPAIAAGVIAAACASLLAAGGCSDELPPLPEAIIVVDSDAQIPRLVDRVRVDFYDDAGTWVDSRDLPRRSARDWPLSFSVYGANESERRTVLLRLRAYSEGHVRDYRGERFMERPALEPAGEIVAWPAAPEGEAPRLLRDGIDVTPDTEPIPELTIDRLVVIDLEPGVRATYRVLLEGQCFGTMADLAARRTCVDRENQRVDASPETQAGDTDAPSQVGEFGAPRPCTITPRASTQGKDGVAYFDDEVCVPGGAFIFGSADITGTLNFSYASVPERVAVVSPLLVDRYEVTVGRWRRARSEGFVPPYDPEANDAPLPTNGQPSFPETCTYSSEPLGREMHPVNCLAWDEARAFCQFHGGDLLTEAQWEFAASATGDARETLYPWGNDGPDCEAQIYGRPVPAGATGFCEDVGFGPAPVGAGPGDVTPIGVRDMGGSMSEWILDSPRPYDARCWASVGLVDPSCLEEDVTHRSPRGGGWSLATFEMLSSIRPARSPVTRLFPHVGFRCARPGSLPPIARKQPGEGPDP